jgi:hypothetical protein
MNIASTAKQIFESNDEIEISMKVYGLMGEYVKDWEDEFDDIHEAYEEQGRGEAECQVIREAIEAFCKTSDVVLTDNEYLEVFDTLADLWGLSTN